MVRGRRGSKRSAQRIHFMRRCRERLGVWASGDDVVSEIQAGRSVPIERQSSRVTVHQVEIDGRKVAVVYDKTRKCAVTVVPLEEFLGKLEGL